MSLWDKMFNFENYGELLALLQNSIIAGALLGLIGGLIGVFVMMRDLTFAVHGISELSFAGASFALLVGFNVVIGSILGSLIAALVIGVLGVRARERSSIIGVLMPFGLGLGVLFLALYPGRAANKFGLLTGQIVAVDDPQLLWMLGVSVVVIIALGDHVAAADVRHRRPGDRRRPRRPGARAVADLHDHSGADGGDGGAGGRCPAGAGAARHPGGRRDAGHRVGAVGAGAVRRRSGRCRWSAGS